MRSEPLLKTSAIHVVIADDHPLVRDGLRKILEQEADVKVVGEAANGDEAFECVRKLQPDVLLLDIAMPATDGMTVLRELRLVPHRTRVVLLTAAIEKAQIAEAIRLGACGMVMKTSPMEVLIRSIRAVLAGEYWFDRSILAEAARTDPQKAAVKHQMTQREIEIVALVADGSSNKDIADKIGISEPTVKRHLANIFHKTGVSSRLELAVLVLNRQVTPKR